MRLLKTLISTAFLLMIISNASAQVDRRIGGRQYQNPNVGKRDKVDYTEFAVARLKADLSLDNFQEAVISTIISDNQQKFQQVLAQEIPDDAKREELNKLNEVVKGKIRDVLNPEQIEKFARLDDKKKKKK